MGLRGETEQRAVPIGKFVWGGEEKEPEEGDYARAAAMSDREKSRKKKIMVWNHLET